MKQRIYMVLGAVVLSVMTGCSSAPGTANRTGDQTSQVDKVIQQQIEKDEAKTTEVPDQVTDVPAPITDTPVKVTDAPEQITDIPVKVTDAPEQITDIPVKVTDTPDQQHADTLPKYDKVDVDLTELTSTLIYGEVYNIMMDPEKYIGKTVRMEGNFYTFWDEIQNQYYFACVIQDATACCAQGIEFVLAGDYTYPDDYPEEGSFIRVAGVFDTYEDEEYIYCTLRNAVME